MDEKIPVLKQLYNKTHERVEEKKQKEEDEAEVVEAAQEMRLFRKEAVPVIKKFPTAAQIAGGIRLRFSDEAQQQWQAMESDATNKMGAKMEECSNNYAKKMRAEGDRIVGRIHKTEGKIALPPVFCYSALITFLVMFMLTGAIIMFNETQLHSSQIAKVYWTGGTFIVVANSLVVYVNHKWLNN